MRILVIFLAAVIAAIVLGVVAWLTGGHPAAFLAAATALGLAGVLGAGSAGTPPIVTLPPFVRTALGWAIALCLVVIFVIGARHWWRVYQAGQPPAPTTATAPTAPARPQTPAPVVMEPLIIKGTTPATHEIDFEFNLVSTHRIRVEYDGRTVIHDPAKDCQQWPAPRPGIGPVKFTFTNPDGEGQVPYAIYRLRPGEGACK